MRFENVKILSVSHIDAPHPVGSDEIESKLEATMKRLGVPPGMLERFSGIKSRRHFDEEMPPSEAATKAGEQAIEKADIDHLLRRARRIAGCTLAELAAVEGATVHPALVRGHAPVIVLGRPELRRLVEVRVVQVAFLADILSEVDHGRRTADQRRNDHARFAGMPATDEIGARDALLVVVFEEVQHVCLDVEHIGMCVGECRSRLLAAQREIEALAAYYGAAVPAEEE